MYSNCDIWVILLHLYIGTTAEVIFSMLDAGADPMTRDISENTPLHSAARLERWEIAYALLRAGADQVTIQTLVKNPLRLKSVI